MAKVYVGTYKKYNEGSLHGAWLDLADYENYSDFLKACHKVHKNESDPEFMIQDSEGFPDGLDCMEWLSESDFNDVKAAMNEEKPSIRIIEYSEKAFAVVGDTRPVKDELKKMGGRFNGKLSCGAGWIFSNKSRENVEAFINTGSCVASKCVKNVSNDEDRALFDEYMKEWEKVWKKDSSMIDYERKRFSSAIRLQNGGILYFEKPSIDNKFCFHDEGPQYEIYKELTSKEEKLAKYFKASNLSDFDSLIKGLQKLEHWEGRDYYGKTWYIQRECYSSQTEPLNLFKYIALSDYDVQNHPTWYEGVEKMTETDRKAIVKALEKERAKFEKRLDTYLKRYGVSKLHTWTYWADA